MINRTEIIRMAAPRLTLAQVAELRHYPASGAFCRPASNAVARRMWLGIRPAGYTLFVLQRRHGACEYRITPVGRALLAEVDRNND